MSERKQLLTEIEAFLLKNKMPASRFGHLALNDKGFMTRFRNGADIRMETAAALRNFMKKNHKRKRPPGATRTERLSGTA